MPVCGVIAGFFAFVFRDHLGRAIKGWWGRHLGHGDKLDEIQARLEAHAELLDHETPGGLGAVMDEVRRAVTAAESAHSAVQALGVIAGSAKAPRRGATEMRSAGGTAPPAAAGGPGTSGRKPATGMGSRVTPKTTGKADT
jgi:hypothetical protein